MKPLLKREKLNIKIDTIMEILVPIFVCVVLPVAIVLIVGLTKQNATNRKAEIMLKAIESGVQLDPEFFKSESRKPKSIKEELVEKLSGACIVSLMGAAFLILWLIGSPAFFMSNMMPVAGAVMVAVGIGLFISYFVGKKMLAKEIEAEENAL
jgi:hypothetical protein